jgi:hypothetical protein
MKVRDGDITITLAGKEHKRFRESRAVPTMILFLGVGRYPDSFLNDEKTKFT